MKKYFLITLVFFGLLSCEDDVRFNNPSFQGLKDNVFWRGVRSKATIASDGSLLIESLIVNETISLKTAAAEPQTYFLGTSEASKAICTVTGPATGIVTYTTGFGVGQGQIIITEYDAINKTITGTFKFSAENTNRSSQANATVNFQQGVFYKIPVQKPLVP
ncbi:DUF6252 family protein [Flavobacterium sp. XS1P32]|uniref:DUF6252 family protein n=1 Tax=unclassified Flavobacterium TaxID=196869 RepID=UPI003AAED745